MKTLACAIVTMMIIYGYSIMAFQPIVIENSYGKTAQKSMDDGMELFSDACFRSDSCLLSGIVRGGELPVVQLGEDYDFLTGEFTAYTPSEDETDGNPFITADGTDKRNYNGCILAHKSLPFGTEVYVPYFNMTCEVHDRMPKRSKAEFDVFLNTKEEAFQFGRRSIEYVII